MKPTIEEVVALQAERGITDHLVWFGPGGFVMAHTDEERETIDLEDCPLHVMLANLNGPPMQIDGKGYYVLTPHSHDPTSESFRSGATGWTFTPLT